MSGTIDQLADVFGATLTRGQSLRGCARRPVTSGVGVSGVGSPLVQLFRAFEVPGLLTQPRQLRQGVGVSGVGSVHGGAFDVPGLLAQLRQLPQGAHCTYPHLKAEFDRQRQAAQEAGQQPDPRLAQIERLKAEVANLRERLSRKNTELDALEEFQVTALSRLAAPHGEITTLRRQFDATPAASVRTLPRR